MDIRSHPDLSYMTLKGQGELWCHYDLLSYRKGVTFKIALTLFVTQKGDGDHRGKFKLFYNHKSHSDIWGVLT